MWFRNIQFYRFEQPFTTNASALNDALETHKARPCGQMEMATEGWAKPLGLEGEMLVHETDGRLMICLRREDKVLPASLVRELMEARAFEIEQQAGRPVGRKERADIREQLMMELLPRALVKASHTFAYIDPKGGWLVVNAAASKKSEELIMLLRKSLGTLNVVLPQTRTSPEAAMSEWIMNDAALPEGFLLEDECELRSVGEVTSTVRVKYVDVVSKEVRAHVLAGKRVFKMGMGWQGKVSFVLHDDTSIRRLRFDSELLDQADVDGDATAQFDADFAIMGAELGMLIPELLAALDSCGEA